MDLPVLCRKAKDARADLRSPRPEIARRHDHLGEHPHRLSGMQFTEGQLPARRMPDVPDPQALPANQLRAAGQRPRLSAQLPARKLERLSVLGYGTGAGVDIVVLINNLTFL